MTSATTPKTASFLGLPTSFNAVSIGSLGSVLAIVVLTMLQIPLSAQTSAAPRTFPRASALSQQVPGSAYSGAASTVATTTSMAVLDDTRKLGVGDTISFRVVEDRDPPVPLIVTDSGEMEVPYIGRVKAVGRTCKSLATSIKSALEVDYYYKATVIVALDAISTISRGKITVSGQVVTQGTQDIPPAGEFTASKAIANALGLSRFGDDTKIRIIRQSSNGAPEIIIFNLRKFFKGEGPDVILQPNDTINVPQRLINGFN